MPIFVSQIWGELLLFFVRGRPIFSGKDQLTEFYKKNQAAMFVANHNSWLDIPFIGGTIGWRNYKLVSKAELGRVPILGKAIKMGGHLMLDRADRKSQLMTLRQGMELLKVREMTHGIVDSFKSYECIPNSFSLRLSSKQPHSHRMEFTCVPFRKELVPKTAVWVTLRMVRSKWHTRWERRSFPSRLSDLVRLCHTIGCSHSAPLEASPSRL